MQISTTSTKTKRNPNLEESPFGSLLPGRNYSSSSYRFGFNGKEKDDEVKGSGCQYDYGFRIYDPRIAKFLSVDPLTSNFPWYTPYQFAGNKPIIAIDLDGAEELIVVRWYDQGVYVGETAFRVTNESNRLTGYTHGALYVNMDNSLRQTVNSEFTSGTWQNRFLNQDDGAFRVGTYSPTFRNQFDIDRNNALIQANTESNQENSIYINRLPGQLVFFAEASSTIPNQIPVNSSTADNQQTLNRIDNLLSGNPDYTPLVTGSANTNNLSGTYDNNALSIRRANAVATEIRNDGHNVSPANVQAIGASTNLLGSTPQGTLDLNRNTRVDFVVPANGPIIAQ